MHRPMPATTASSTAVDLSRLPPPDVVEAFDYETILAAKLARLQAALPGFDALVESDPAIKIIEICAYDELVIRQRVNDAARACMIAYAGGADLENLAALFGVARLEITPANAQTGAAAVMESDEDLRRRVLLAPDSYSVAGPASAYVYHALSSSADVLDASATSPAPGEVVVSVLARTGTGAADAALLAAVEAVVGSDEVRPLTDEVTVQSAEIVEFDISAELTLYAGPDADIILAAANEALDSLLARQRRIGRDITRSAIFSALHAAGVQNVVLSAPAADVVIGNTEAAHLVNRSVTVTGTGE